MFFVCTVVHKYVSVEVSMSVCVLVSLRICLY